MFFNRIRNILFDLLSLFLPRVCICCGELLSEAEVEVCTRCRRRAPLTQMWQEPENVMMERFYGIVPVERASAFMWYTQGSPWRSVIHSLKYRRRWMTAVRMGEWYAHNLVEAGLLADVDAIVPVPLHWRRRARRGYNQAEYIALGMSRVSGVPVEFGAVVRAKDNPSQAQQSRYVRWSNVDSIFRVSHPERLRGRRVLLVDDVCTTGATISSCALAIVEACDGDVRIDMGALAMPMPRAMGV
ncbi:MAG: ComF family protein [Alistipes sp.]|nr:ComF family protein [Alistipes sp.]